MEYYDNIYSYEFGGNRKMTYRVSQHETMYDIAQKSGISLQELLDYNRLTASSPIFPGMILRIPRRRRRPPVNTQPQGNRYYTVRRGDTLQQISRRVGVSVENLMRMNNMTHQILLPGQRLIIQLGIEPF